MTIEEVVILGGGSAGLMAAVTLKRKMPELKVTVLRSQELGTIGVGEGTTPNFTEHVLGYLGVHPKMFYEVAQPTWKLGLRLEWGQRPHYDFSFALNLDAHWSDLPMSNGYYLDESFEAGNPAGAMMAAGKVFARRADGSPEVAPWHAFHVENVKLIRLFEQLSRGLGVELVEGRVAAVERGGEGVRALVTEDGRRFRADLFVDASGFRSELLGTALEEPFVDFGKRHLFCDRAVVGGWERSGEPILPYTTAETMDSGWCWRIEHERWIHRGYVYGSGWISDEEAEAEFVRKNPKAAGRTRVVKFRSGFHRRSWVGNVVAIGNSAGFVEPLEATALMLVSNASRDLTNLLLKMGRRVSDSMRDLYNRRMEASWTDIRDFLAIHYRFNDRLDTPFWRHCREETDLSGVEELLRFYRENGPSGYARYALPNSLNDFGVEGYLVMLVGNRVPHAHPYRASDAERQRWNQHRAELLDQARNGFDVAEALAWFRRHGWNHLVGVIGASPS
ncbi:tryptophan halogenase [Haloferula luteola]|uniref:Tryptophan halogenase n=1 Tax=Haloferula luteola TaxID=595692 RepID=A0A840VJ06_9BACT|nr:FAD-dependent oxidoreductase [Haloferula luteola]MBB5353769.1 tryptophan halogenase [Haloferula luteola]